MLHLRQHGHRTSPRAPLLAVAALVLFLAGCHGGLTKSGDVAYVTAPQANLRDRVAALYNKTGSVQNGEQVMVLDHSRRFSKVKNARGEVGWLEDRFLIGPQVYAQFQMMAKASASFPVQSRGVTRVPVNVHLSPGRDSDHLYQLHEGEKVEILKRATTEKPQTQGVPARPPRPAVKDITAKDEPPPSPPMEDWWMIRDSRGHVGWVLARMVDIDIPLDVAQYAEGQRIVGSVVLNQVQDGEQKVNQYLVFLTDPRDGLPYDFNQFRIFTWNAKKHRYETAYRERNLYGTFPYSVGTQDFGKEGVLPTFVVRVQDEQGTTIARKYKMIGPIVRRVLSPEEEREKLTPKRVPRLSKH